MARTFSSGTPVSSLLWPILAGFVLGCALQLQQSALWPGAFYVGLLLVAAALFWMGRRARRSTRWHGVTLLVTTLATMALGFGAVGLRSSVFMVDALDPTLEGRDIRVTGVVSAMPQRNEAGLRFVLALESAQLEGRAVKLPPQLMLGWNAGMGGGFDAGNMLADLQRQPDRKSTRLNSSH